MKPRIFKSIGFWHIAWPDGRVSIVFEGFRYAVRLASSYMVQRNKELNDFAAQTSQGHA